ncbi:cytochrome P450, partial [Diaporthe helianthi]
VLGDGHGQSKERWNSTPLRTNQPSVKSHGFLKAMEAGNLLVVILAAAKTYPFLYPLALMFAPWKVMRSLPRMISEAKVQVVHRIKMRHDLKHSDYFEQLLPADRPSPTNDKQISHMLTVAGQLILGGYDPTSVAIYMGFYFLLRNPTSLQQVRQEVRESFQQYGDIEVEALRTLPYLNACLQETLRLSAAATHHSLPRISPGAMVNNEYIPKGVICRNSLFAYSRSARFFHNPKDFKLERWLPKNHRSYDAKFSTDSHGAHFPFIMGPRQCPGREVARHMFRLVMAKIIWSYDVEQLSKPLDFDQDFRVYSMWVKPELCIRLRPAQSHRAR